MLGERCYKFKNVLRKRGECHRVQSVDDRLQEPHAGDQFRLGIPYWGINQTVTAWQHQNRGFSSLHPGGVHLALCDGSVRFISDTIDFRANSISGMKNPNEGSTAPSSDFSRRTMVSRSERFKATCVICGKSGCYSDSRVGLPRFVTFR